MVTGGWVLPGAHRKVWLACLNNFTGWQEVKLAEDWWRRLVQLIGAELVGAVVGEWGVVFLSGYGISGERAELVVGPGGRL